MYEMLDVTTPLLPANKPRYLMGVGQPEQMLEAIKRGVDMFDCVLPTRNARHGQIYLHTANHLVDDKLEQVFYRRQNISSAQFATDTSVLDSFCVCTTCSAGYSKAYLRHLISIGEPSGLALATVHNVSFYVDLMKQIRQHLHTR
ncbi:MAG: Queuine tRNA-ribosyltransferase [uncultured bacterium]|nr:MAG: Queuine tRNA-ribosyltransferase [uncultured bacterium]